MLVGMDVKIFRKFLFILIFSVGIKGSWFWKNFGINFLEIYEMKKKFFFLKNEILKVFCIYRKSVCGCFYVFLLWKVRVLFSFVFILLRRLSLVLFVVGVG